MLELAIFLAALALLCWRDISAMWREGLRRELIPYLTLSAAAVVLGVMYILTPDRRSIMQVILRTLKIHE